jgi:hypothetical protein
MEEKEIVDALIIGDGTIEKYKNISGRIQIRHKIQHKEYCDWIISKTKDHLNWITKKVIKSQSIIDGRVVKGTQFSIRTSRDKRLIKHKNRWYPNGEKELPKDFTLTEFILAVLIMDDGSLGISRNGKTYIQKNITINTQGFKLEDIIRLSKMIHKFGILCSIQKTSRNKNHHVIVIAGEKQCIKLIEIIKKYVNEVPCMFYKIDMTRTGRM